jgi:hypothetical protein
MAGGGSGRGLGHLPRSVAARPMVMPLVRRRILGASADLIHTATSWGGTTVNENRALTLARVDGGGAVTLLRTSPL